MQATIETRAGRGVPSFRNEVANLRYSGTLGLPETRVSVLGLVGEDIYVNQPNPPLPKDKFPLGSKHGMTVNRRNQLVHQFGIHVDPNRRGLGQTGANFAVAYAKYDDGVDQVTLHTPLAENDPSSNIIRRKLSDLNVFVDATPHNGTNPSGYHIIDEHASDKVAWLTNHIDVHIRPQFSPDTGFIMIASTGGDWERALTETVEYAKEHNLPYGMLGSESQLKQFYNYDEDGNRISKNEEKITAYLDAYKGTSIWLGNDSEAKLIVEATGQTPSDDALELASQMKSLSENDNAIFSITHGAGLSSLTIGDKTHILNSKTLRAENTAGAGDQYAAALYYKLRQIVNNGFNIRAVGRAMMEAAFATWGVIRVEDTMSGQMTKKRSEEFGQVDDQVLEQSLGFSHHVYALAA